MKYQREIHFTLHDYKTKKQEEKWMERFLNIHEELDSTYYIDTLRELIKKYENKCNCPMCTWDYTTRIKLVGEDE